MSNEENAIRLFTVSLNSNLLCQRIIKKERMNISAFNFILEEIENTFF